MNKNIYIILLLILLFIIVYKYYNLYIYTLNIDNNLIQLNNIIFPFNFLFNKLNKKK